MLQFEVNQIPSLLDYNYVVHAHTLQTDCFAPVCKCVIIRKIGRA